MRGQGKGLARAAHGGMEFAWLYAWAAYTLFNLSHRLFPFFASLAAFSLAAVLTLLSRGRGWRILSVLGLQTIALLLAAATALYAFSYRSFSYFSLVWLERFLAEDRSPVDWIVLLLFFFWILVLWLGGVALGRRDMRYYKICGRFDLGIAAFLTLFLIHWALVSKGAGLVFDPLSRVLIFPFFVFSLFTLGLIRNGGEGRRSFPGGYRGVGLISGALAMMVLIGTGVFFVFIPYFAAVAGTGYGVLKEAAEPFGPVIVSILRFLFAGRRLRSACLPPDGGKGPEPGAGLLMEENGPSGGIIETLLKWITAGFLGAVFLAAAVLGTWYLVKWLLSRTPGEGRGPSRGLLSHWIERLRALLLYCQGRLLQLSRKEWSAGLLYKALLIWGSRSGIRRARSETPQEYGVRLGRQFPALGKDITRIIDYFNLEAYGGRPMEEEHKVLGRSAWRRLKSPLNWPSRFRAWFYQSPGPRGKPLHPAD